MKTASILSLGKPSPAILASVRRLAALAVVAVALVYADAFDSCISLAYDWGWTSFECVTCMNDEYNSEILGAQSDYTAACASDQVTKNSCIASYNYTNYPFGSNFNAVYDALYSTFNCAALVGNEPYYTNCTNLVYSISVNTADNARDDPNGICNSDYVSNLAGELSIWGYRDEVIQARYTQMIGNCVYS